VRSDAHAPRPARWRRGARVRGPASARGRGYIREYGTSTVLARYIFQKRSMISEIFMHVRHGHVSQAGGNRVESANGSLS
jgi:hypothetical protein